MDLVNRVQIPVQTIYFSFYTNALVTYMDLFLLALCPIVRYFDEISCYRHATIVGRDESVSEQLGKTIFYHICLRTYSNSNS